MYTISSLPKTIAVFWLDETVRINDKQVYKQDVFRFFYNLLQRNFWTKFFSMESTQITLDTNAVENSR